MALIKCPECGKEISDKSKQCIHCGYPLGEYAGEISGTFTVVLNSYIGSRIETIKYVRSLLDIDIKTAKRKVDGIPIILASDVSKEDADRIKSKFDAMEASISIRQYEPTDLNVEVSNKRVCCPHCGSDQVVPGRRGFSLLTGFLGSNKTVNRCARCGWDWSPRI